MAYQVLSDPASRKRYDEFGSEAEHLGPEGGFTDPKELFRHIFGGEAFVEIIGEISFVQLFADAQADGANDSSAITQGSSASEKQRRAEREREAKRKRAERVQMLLEKLTKKVNLLVEGNYSTAEFTEYIRKEAMCLRKESFGTELLHAVGYTYEMRARQYIGQDQMLGLTGFWYGLQERGHAIGSFFSTVKSATKAISSAHELQKQTQTAPGQNPPPQMIKKAEENMRDLMINAVSLEVQGVVGDVCDRLLPSSSKSISKAVLKKRAQALKIIGTVYGRIEPPPPGESNNFF